MDLKDWKRTAEHEVYSYRDHQAYVQGVLDCGKISGGEKLHHCAKWALAVDYALRYLKQHDPLKARFFTELFGIERPLRRRSEARSIIALSMELNVAPPTLYKWKNEALSLVLIAAAQTGALRPYALDAWDPPQDASRETH